MPLIATPLEVVAVSFPDEVTRGVADSNAVARSALLYGDTASVISLAASTVSSLASLEHADVSTVLSYMEAFARRSDPRSASGLAALRADYEAASRVASPSFQQQLALQRARDKASAYVSGRLRFIKYGLEPEAAKELLRALESKSYRLRDFDANATGEEGCAAISQLTLEAMNEPNSYALMDKQAAGLFRAMVPAKAEALTEGVVTRARAAKLASRLFNRLPGFETATLSEILEIRNALERPLTQFRAKLLSLSAQIESAPWDGAFEAEAEDLFTREINDEVLELEERIAEDEYIRVLSRRFNQDGTKIVGIPGAIGSGVSFVVGNASNSVSIAQAAAGAAFGLTVGAVSLALQARDEWKQKQAEIRNNHFYFLVETQAQLERVSS